MKTLRAGIAGVGFIGLSHIDALKRMSNVEIVAVADVSGAGEKAKSLNINAVYDDYKKMVDEQNLDCLHVCLPNSLHFEASMYALEHGVNVICEKPLTTTKQQALQMCEVAKKSGLVNGMNFISRFYPMAAQLKQMVQRGDLGSVYFVHGVWLQDWLFYDTDYNWRLDPASGGESRAFSDLGSHWIDLVEYTIGSKATEVMADFEIFHKTRKKPLKPIETFSKTKLNPEDYLEVPVATEDYAAVLFHFENGAHGCVTICQTSAGRKNQMTLTVGGSKSSATFDTEKSNEIWVGMRDEANKILVKDPSLLYPEARKYCGYPGGHAEGYPDAFLYNLRSIYESIESGIKKPLEYADFESGARELEICEAIIKSAKTRSWVKI